MTQRIPFLLWALLSTFASAQVIAFHVRGKRRQRGGCGFRPAPRHLARGARRPES